jgi:predicted ATPase
VTIVGSGGIGKTRTTLEVAARMIDEASDGTWFVELAPLLDGAYIAREIARAIGVSLPSEDDQLTALARALADRHALLVLDNCEHLIDAAARAVATLTRACPNVRVLASSRQALNVAGETTYRLPTLATTPAVELFGERARLVDPRFAPTDDDAAAVVAICRRLDGIPLAIELAAARVAIMSPHRLLERLDERFRVLTGGSRDLLPRQQTLRALIDWSFDLLDPREQSFFRRLGIFVGGFTIDNATAVCAGDDVDELDVFDLVASLADKSLILRETDDGSDRYRMLESTRAYARERLAASSDGETIPGRHLAAYVASFERAAATWDATASSVSVDALLTREIDDVRAALDWGFAHDVRSAARLLASIGPQWDVLGANAEGRERIGATLERLGSDDPRRSATLKNVVVRLLGYANRVGAMMIAAVDALSSARSAGDADVLAAALANYAQATVRSGRTERTDEAATALVELGNLPNLSPAARLSALTVNAFVATYRNDIALAVSAAEELRDALRRIGDPREVLRATVNLAELEHRRGNSRRSIDLVEEVLLQAHTDDRQRNHLRMNAANYCAALDDFPAARAYLRELVRSDATTADRRSDSLPLRVVALETVALTAASAGDVACAARLIGFVDAYLPNLDVSREYTELRTHDRVRALLDERLSPAERDRSFAEGAKLTVAAALDVARNVLDG